MHTLIVFLGTFAALVVVFGFVVTAAMCAVDGDHKWAWVFLILSAFVCAQLFTFPARAGLVTEIGGGIKMGGAATILKSNCVWAVPFDAEYKPLSDGYGHTRVTVPCGGHNPVFVGWPLAWEFPNGVRFGWFHQSNWFDGPPFNHNPETHFNCLCASKTIHWSK